jgi:hypothetical protein
MNCRAAEIRGAGKYILGVRREGIFANMTYLRVKGTAVHAVRIIIGRTVGDG